MAIASMASHFGAPLVLALADIGTKGEQKDFEVYSCHVSPDGKRLATAGGGMWHCPLTQCYFILVKRLGV